MLYDFTPILTKPFFRQDLYSYSIIFSTIVAFIYVFYINKRYKLFSNAWDLIQYGVILYLAAYFGSKVYLIIQNADSLIKLCVDPINAPAPFGPADDADCLAVFKFFISYGFAWYGTLLGAIITIYFYVGRNMGQFLKFADPTVPIAAYALALGRIGCFSAGCCHGIPTDAWYSVGLPYSQFPLFPSQLIMIFYNIALAGFLFYLIFGRKKQKFTGEIFLWYLTIYPVCRFAVELFRGDDARGLIWTVEKVVTVAGKETTYHAGFTLPMFFSIVLFGAAVYGWSRVRRNGRLIEDDPWQLYGEPVWETQEGAQEVPVKEPSGSESPIPPETP